MAIGVHANYELYNSSFENGSGTTPYSWWRNNAGREGWSALTGAYGCAIYGWNVNQDGSFGQDIGTAADGGGNGLIVTFGLWMLPEAQYTADVNRLQIEFWTNGAPAVAALAQMVMGENLNTYLMTNINNWGYYQMTATSQFDNLLGVKVLMYGGPFRGTFGNRALKCDNATLHIPTAWGNNLLKDPSFTGRTWSYTGQGGYEDWAGNFGGGFAFYGWNAGGSAAVWRQEAVTPSAGPIYTFSIYGLTEELYASSTEDTKLEIFLLDSLESVIDSVQKNVYWTLRNNSNKWTLVSVSITNNSPSVAYARVRVSGSGFVNPPGSGYKSAKWDTARLIQVPEPATVLILLALGGAATRRRI
ncbi:MAG: PEP-CTERM sorting domain-containing protein [bacterium]|nr:PEP-CTERM sorting domain-containing protein [bacterium]